jgi:hypothetical protein
MTPLGVVTLSQHASATEQSPTTLARTLDLNDEDSEVEMITPDAHSSLQMAKQYRAEQIRAARDYRLGREARDGAAVNARSRLRTRLAGLVSAVARVVAIRRPRHV